MKKTLTTVLLIALAVLLQSELKAQGIKMPQPSSGQTIS